MNNTYQELKRYLDKYSCTTQFGLEENRKLYNVLIGTVKLLEEAEEVILKLTRHGTTPEAITFLDKLRYDDEILDGEIYLHENN